MLYRKFVFALTLTVILAMGCAEQYNTKLEQTNDVVDNVHIASFSQSSADQQPETMQVSEPKGVLTLGQALALALMYNPELKAFSLQVRASQAGELQAGLWPNPELEVEVEEIGGTGERSDFDAAEMTIQLSQLVELGNKSQKRKKVASFEKQLADLDYRNKRLEVFTETTKAFIVVLKTQEKLELSNELVKLSRELFDVVDKKVAAGKDPPLEKTRSSIALSKMEIQYREDQRNLDFARKRLASFWAQDEPCFKRAAGALDDIEEIPELNVLVSYLRLNPEFARWEVEVRKSEAVMALEKSKEIPDVRIGAGVQRFNDADDNAVVFGVSVPLPISDRNQGARQEAAFNLARTKEEQKSAWLKLQNGFNRTYQELANAYSQATALGNEVLPGAMEMFEVATRAYQEGKVDYLSVLDAQRTLFEVKAQYIDALNSYHSAKADVERLIGHKLDDINNPLKAKAEESE